MKVVRIFLIILILICLPLFLFVLANPVILVPWVLIFYIVYSQKKKYKSSAYYQSTHLSRMAIRFDKGRYGEYLIYKYLKKQEENGAKFLFNVYVPKENGETSEIDVLMIHNKGIFVFESKNFSGWIFGNETQRIWTQTLPKGRGHSHKESFFNPIMQNKTHIKTLEAFLERNISTKSVIVFSERCTLKNVQVNSDDLYVIKRNQVVRVVNEICNSVQEEVLSSEEILDIYNRLYPFTQVNEEIKKQHINNIRGNRDMQAEKNSVGEEDSLKEDKEIVEKQSEEIVLDEAINVHEETSASDEQTTVVTELREEVEESNLNEEEKSLKCPRCGGTLVFRTAKKGANIGQQFYGCSNYPKCRYVRNI